MNALRRLRYTTLALANQAIEAAVLAKTRLLRQKTPDAFDRWVLDGQHRLMLRQIEQMRAAASANAAANADDAGSAAGGVHNSQVALRAADPRWSLAAMDEATIVRLAVGDDCLAVHHIGSTAVEQLDAKPIIDLAVVLPAEKFPTILGPALAALGQVGYRYVGVRGGVFLEKGPAPIRTHAVQIHPSDSFGLEMILRFRGLLRADPRLRDDYAATKAALAHHLPRQRWIYAIYKGHWIQEQQWRESGAKSWVDWFIAQSRSQFRLSNPRVAKAG